jgi:hypothetical protein
MNSIRCVRNRALHQFVLPNLVMICNMAGLPDSLKKSFVSRLAEKLDPKMSTLADSGISNQSIGFFPMQSVVATGGTH